MTWLPFICLFCGLFIGLRTVSSRIFQAIDLITNFSLILLMLTIGANIGINNSVISNLSKIGFNCMFISLSAIIFSIIITFVLEKTFLPLESIRNSLNFNDVNLENEIPIEAEEPKTSPLIWIMPLSIILGIILGYFLIPEPYYFLLNHMLTISLIILYTSVGVSLGSHRKIFGYIKLLGFRIIYLSVSIFIGSLLGGFISSLILNIPINIAILSSSGMSYYSITGAYLAQVYGVEAGTYGFIVNVMREFFTVLLLPLIIKISKGSPIAAGAAGNMDTMLVPVTKFVGSELGLVALITGTILTFSVPIILPTLTKLFF